MDQSYGVVSPIGDARDAAGSEKKAIGAQPLDSLDGKKIALIWTEFYNGDTALRAFGAHLGQRYSNLKFIEMAPGRGRNWGDHPDATIGELARENGVHGAIVAAGC
ncbi:MAG: hypothetical protein ACREFD_11195 [Stellaceae bacterium]